MMLFSKEKLTKNHNLLQKGDEIVIHAPYRYSFIIIIIIIIPFHVIYYYESTLLLRKIKKMLTFLILKSRINVKLKYLHSISIRVAA